MLGRVCGSSRRNRESENQSEKRTGDSAQPGTIRFHLFTHTNRLARTRRLRTSRIALRHTTRAEGSPEVGVMQQHLQTEVQK